MRNFYAPFIIVLLSAITAWEGYAQTISYTIYATRYRNYNNNCDGTLLGNEEGRFFPQAYDNVGGWTGCPGPNKTDNTSYPGGTGCDGNANGGGYYCDRNRLLKDVANTSATQFGLFMSVYEDDGATSWDCGTEDCASSATAYYNFSSYPQCTDNYITMGADSRYEVTFRINWRYTNVISGTTTADTYTICAGSTVNFTISGGTPGNRHRTWMGAVPSVGSTSLIAGWNECSDCYDNLNSFSRTFNTPGVYLIRTHPRNCADEWNWGSYSDIWITVNSTANNPGAISAPSSICVGGTADISNVTAAGTGTPASSAPSYYYYWQRTSAPVVGWQMYDGPTSSLTSSLPAAVTGTPGTYVLARNSAFACAGQVSAPFLNFTVVADPVAPTLGTATPASGSTVCMGGTVSASINAGSSGMGTCTDYYQYTTDGGSSWSAYTPGASITAVSTGIDRIQVQTRRDCNGTGCDGSGETFATIAKWTVVADPVWATNTVSPTNICQGSNVTFSGTVSGGLGGTVSWVRATSPGGAGSTVTSPNTPPAAGTFYYRPQYTASGTGCNLADGTETAVTVDTPPGTANNTTSGAAICETSTKALTATPAGGSWSVVSGGGSIAGATYTPANVATATSVTIRYTVAAVGACPGSTSDVTFTVNADPGTAVNTTSNAAICETSVKALTGTPAGGTWSVISGGGSIAGTTYMPADVASATSVTLRYSIAASGVCPGSTSDVTFTVDASPGTASNSTSNAAICETSVKALTGTPAGGTWSVVSGGGSIAGTTYTPANVASATSVTVRYSIAASGTCPGSTSDVTFTVDADPGAASNTTSNAAICETATKVLTGTPAGGSWSVVSGGGSIAGATYTPANISSPTGVTVRYSLAASGACPGPVSDVTFTTNPIPAAFTASVTTTTPLCFGGNARIDLAGEAGVEYQLRDNVTNVNAGNGPGAVMLHTANLTANTNTYNVQGTVIATGCSLNVAVPTITVSPVPAVLANNNDVRTCYLNGNNAYVEFFSANGSIVAINPGTQNLGDVTVTEYVGLPLGIQACGTSPSTQPEFNTATLGRHWTVSSTVAPTSNLNVRLYFSDADVAALSLASLANVNTFDDVNSAADMELSKYSGANENGSFPDNCGNGTVTLHPQVGNGTMSAGNIGYTVSAAGYTVHTVSSFSELWLSGTNNVSPLPIELTSFTATCVNGRVSLHWVTASEINNEKFLVERSGNLETWEEVALLPGAGNSNQPLNYQTVDERPLQGLSYYRLTQRDYDGKSETFAPVSVTCYADGNGNTLMVYPNPATHEFKVAVTANRNAAGTLRVTEANGKTVFLQNLNLVKGQNEFRVDAAALNPGTYVVHLESENMELKPVKMLIIK